MAARKKTRAANAKMRGVPTRSAVAARGFGAKQHSHAAPHANLAVAKANAARAKIVGVGHRVRPEEGKSLGAKIRASAVSQRMWMHHRTVSEYARHQRKMWALAVSVALVLFVILLVFQIGMMAGFWGEPSLRQKEILEEAEYIGLLIFGLDIYGRYRVATDKMLFLKHNTIEIIAILPMGMFFKVGQAFEIANVLQGSRIAGKAEGAAVLAPMLAAAGGAHLAPYIAGGAKIMPEISAWIGIIVFDIQGMISNYTVVNEFFSSAVKWLGRAIRLR